MEMHSRHFLNNFGSILIFAIFGTIFSFALTGSLFYLGNQLNMFNLVTFSFANFRLTLLKKFDLIECLAFSAITACTDPVSVLSFFKQINADKRLYALVFGESILNDAVSVIIYK